ncbi:EF-hand domain pair [Artemisia annua]|uniref:EF-hand domain pair n=1 Tax=Artemisia annua TaxID=35608 RepID=A0A2U1M0R1_ARTAN|nr:EF-hand domain pair [Artemisia annua]
MLHQFKPIRNNSLQTERGNGIEKVLTKDNQIRFASTRRCVTRRVIDIGCRPSDSDCMLPNPLEEEHSVSHRSNRRQHSTFQDMPCVNRDLKKRSYYPTGSKLGMPIASNNMQGMQKQNTVASESVVANNGPNDFMNQGITILQGISNGFTLSQVQKNHQSVGSDSHSDRVIIGLESRTSSLQLSLAALICTTWSLRFGMVTIIAEHGDTTTRRLHWDAELLTTICDMLCRLIFRLANKALIGAPCCGDYILLKATDFELSAYIDKGKPTHEKVGTAFYAAPEVLRCEPYGKEVDIWSAGVILCMLPTRAPPFYGSKIKIWQRKKKGSFDVAGQSSIQSTRPTMVHSGRCPLQFYEFKWLL